MKNVIRLFAILLIALWAAAIAANAQNVPCPADKVCISVEQARQALIDADAVKAQAAELAALKQAKVDLEAEINRLRVELARIMGEKTGADQQVVRMTAIIDVLLKNQKKRCLPFSICIG